MCPTNHPHALSHGASLLFALILVLLPHSSTATPATNYSTVNTPGLYQLCKRDPTCADKFSISGRIQSSQYQGRFERMLQLYLTELSAPSGTVLDPDSWMTLALLQRAYFCPVGKEFVLGRGCVWLDLSAEGDSGGGGGGHHAAQEYLVVYVLMGVVFGLVTLYSTFVSTEQVNNLMRSWNNFGNAYVPPELPKPPPSVYLVQQKLSLPR
jgi:hypothetical protein